MLIRFIARESIVSPNPAHIAQSLFESGDLLIFQDLLGDNLNGLRNVAQGICPRSGCGVVNLILLRSHR